jgi:hypothetical protein
VGHVPGQVQGVFALKMQVKRGATHVCTIGDLLDGNGVIRVRLQQFKQRLLQVFARAAGTAIFRAFS